MMARYRQVNAPETKANSEDGKQIECGIHTHFFASIAVIINDMTIKRTVITKPNGFSTKNQYMKQPMLNFSMASATRFANARFCSGVKENIRPSFLLNITAYWGKAPHTVAPRK